MADMTRLRNKVNAAIGAHIRDYHQGVLQLYRDCETCMMLHEVTLDLMEEPEAAPPVRPGRRVAS